MTMEQKAPLVEVSVGPCEIAVLIKGLPHLLLRRSDIVGIQSYIWRVGTRAPIYVLEFSTTNGHEICSDYDERPLWEAILRALGDAKLFNRELGEAPR